MWDRLRLEQLVTNLLSNALKYGNGRPVAVQAAGKATGVRISVEDHGIGIGAEDIARVFRRFERAVSGKNYGGLGLGLFIVQQIVDAHGGTIRVDSRPGLGSKFVVELPRRACAGAAGAAG